MRLLLLSDVHSNLPALEACLQAAPPYDEAINLGDVVGYGANPNEVIDRIREVTEISIRGNHDRTIGGLTDPHDFNPIAAAAVIWTRRTLTEEHRRWLQELPSGPVRHPELEDVQFVHGSPLDEDEYVTNEFGAEDSLRASPFRITFFGHTHLQGAFRLDRARAARVPLERESHSKITTSRLHLEANSKYLINPGSIGQPRDSDWRAAFAVYDSVAQELTFYRVPYDVQKEQEQILAAGLPHRLATRLADGR